jgi:drug/metabolite transporter (DMT)-like permease
LPTFIGYAVWGWVVSKMPVGRATTFLYFVPVAATLIGWLILQERPTFLGLLGGMIAISGVALVNLRARSVRTQNVTASIRSGSKLKQADAMN